MSTTPSCSPRAGLARLGRLDEATEVLDPLQVLPAPGQGALAVECRSDDEATLAVLATLDDAATRAAVTAERVVMARLEGGCAAPIGALAELAEGDDGPEVWLRAVVLSGDGALSVRRSASAPLGEDPAGWPAAAAELGETLAAEMLEDGAGELVGPPAPGDPTARDPSPPIRTICRGAQRMTRATTAKSAAPTPAAQVKPGGVAFVGTGPGDPDLLTVRAVRLIEDADVVITEDPGHADLVRVVRARAAVVGDETTAEVEYVDGGFGEDGQPLTHAARAKVVVKQAKRGLRVVRLLGGDPFLYASGPEEAQAVAKAGIGFEVVPGVSSVGAVPAYAGIPLTTKDHREVAVVTCGDKVDWTRYADTPTLVLLSAVGQIGDIAKQLIAIGRSPETPVAMTRVGTTTEQQTVTSTLERIAADARAARIAPPAITVIGAVVDLREKLSWFETKPLFGWRVLVPRTKEQVGVAVQPPARVRWRAGGGPDHLRRAPAQPAADGQGRCAASSRAATSGSPSPRSTRSRPCGRSSRSTASTPAPSRASRSPRSATRPPRPSPPGACAPTWCPRASSRLPACWRTGPSTTSSFDPINRVCPAAGRHRDREPRCRPDRPRLGVRRRHRLPHRPGRPAAGADPRRDQDRASSTRSSSPRPRPCATWSASPASRTRRRSSR